ncbi:dienelactone hydrolase family protein [Amycolatopsis plumensis]|uniref:Dienelactone hydrolase family protein n=1 Tax=Amycolatopsis plumensis TaxID=236508 RepID=A0ABV5U9U5_9PSEU
MKDEIVAGTVTISGHGGDELEAYLAKPTDETPRGGVVVIHHLPGYDAATKEMVRRFAVEGYNALCPNLYTREAPGADPDDAAATVRAAGGVPDDRLVGDVSGAADYLRALENANGRVGVIGHCSGGRHAFLAACSLELDAAVDCYGAFVVNDPPEAMRRMKPLLGLAPQLSCPLLGIFGADDQFPSPDEVAVLAAELEKHGKEHEFHTYADAGHAFFAVDRPSYRPEAAKDGWERILDFYARTLTA